MHPFFDHRLGHRDVMRLGIGAWVSLCAHGVGAVVALVAIVLFDVRGCLPPTTTTALADDGQVLDPPEYEPPPDEWVVELEPPPEPMPESPELAAMLDDPGALEPPASSEPGPGSDEAGDATDMGYVAKVGATDLDAQAKARELASVLAELDTSQMAMLSAGVATEGILSGGDVPSGLLDEAGRGSPGEGLTGLGKGLGGGGRVLGGPGGLATSGRGAAADIGDLEANTAVAAKPLVVSLDGIRASGGLEVPNVRRFAARATRISVRKCASEAEARGGSLSGRLVLDLDIDESGHAKTVVVSDQPSRPGTTWTDATLIRCARRAIEVARFPKADTSTSARLELSVR